MPKTKAKRKKAPASLPSLDDLVTDLERFDLWAADQNDQVFWDEFFQIEDMLEASDELDPPFFTVKIENHQTGKTKSYPKIRLKAARKKIVC